MRISATGASATKVSPVSSNAATPTARIPAETVPVIHRSRSSPEVRANSLKARIARAATPMMNGQRPAKMTVAASGAIQSHER